MIKSLLLVAVLGLAGCATATRAVSQDADPDAIKVMVLGSFHMGNPGRDVANADIESMLTERRQAEIAAVADVLAEFQPTLVAVERITEAPDYIDPKFADFTPADLLEKADERYQLAYRLAGMTGLSTVYGVDEQPSEGEPDYFPFDELMAHAEATGQMGKLNAEIAEIQAYTAEFSAMQNSKTVAELLIVMNDKNAVSDDVGFYYRTFGFDRGEDQPGAELQAYWFMRNAKIFSKLTQVAKPGDRIVIVYGSGHKFWLDHFAENTPGYVLVDPVPYLEKASGR